MKNAKARSPQLKATSGSKSALKVHPAPVITEKKTKKVGKADLVEIVDHQLLLSIDLKRQSETFYKDIEINTDQKFFPYTVTSRLLVGWAAVSHISSMELKIIPGTPLPHITVRFLEKMTPEEVASLDQATKVAVEASIALVRQYPFVKVETPF